MPNFDIHEIQHSCIKAVLHCDVITIFDVLIANHNQVKRRLGGLAPSVFLNLLFMVGNQFIPLCKKRFDLVVSNRCRSFPNSHGSGGKFVQWLMVVSGHIVICRRHVPLTLYECHTVIRTHRVALNDVTVNPLVVSVSYNLCI